MIQNTMDEDQANEILNLCDCLLGLNMLHPTDQANQQMMVGNLKKINGSYQLGVGFGL